MREFKGVINMTTSIPAAPRTKRNGKDPTTCSMTKANFIKYEADAALKTETERHSQD